MKIVTEQDYIRNWFRIEEENTQKVLDYIFGKSDENPLVEVRKEFRNYKKAINKKNIENY